MDVIEISIRVADNGFFIYVQREDPAEDEMLVADSVERVTEIIDNTVSGGY